jgi:hypothetical protein
MGDQPPRNYNSFVVRVWYAMTKGRLLRAEIDHVQTGAIYVGRDVPESWILETVQLAAALEQESPADGNAGNDRTSNPER